MFEIENKAFTTNYLFIVTPYDMDKYNHFEYKTCDSKPERNRTEQQYHATVVLT